MQTVLRIMSRLENSAIKAVRQGLIMIMPLLIISSIALMLMSLPILAYQNFLYALWGGKIVEILDFVYSGIMDFFAVMLATSTSISYAMIKRQTCKERVAYDNIVLLPLITIATLIGYSGIQYDTFSISELSNTNTFTALFVALVSGKLFFTIKNKITSGKRKKGLQVESSYVEALEGMFPALLTILFFAVFGMVFRMVFGVNSIQEWFSNIASWSLEVIDNDFISGLCILLVIHLLWFLGIHGNNVLDAFIQENYIHLDTSIYNKTFQDVFVVIGGCGAALCLVIAVLLYAKKRNVRHIAKVALPSAIFNISEIIVFGLPVILNSIFLLPFILVPVVNYLISYGAVYIGLIPRVTCEVEWTTPIFLSGYQATGSWT
ncbi:MAG: PTS sugar transporter subunit IIC [Lachnospiraceae bacterium]|nr:PTS sugar transporter subunit IIC [Lachnospiraceae bacterium]